jgi:hypothetical protein
MVLGWIGWAHTVSDEKNEKNKSAKKKIHKYILIATY